MQGSNRGNLTGAMWRFPASLLQHGVGKQHRFKVAVAKGTRTSVAEVDITPRATATPSGSLLRMCSGGVCPQRHRPNAPLTLQLAAARGVSYCFKSFEPP